MRIGANKRGMGKRARKSAREIHEEGAKSFGSLVGATMPYETNLKIRVCPRNPRQKNLECSSYDMKQGFSPSVPRRCQNSEKGQVFEGPGHIRLKPTAIHN